MKNSVNMFERVKTLLKEHTGIHLAPHKEALAENRLTRLSTKIKYDKSLEELLSEVESGSFVEEFISSFTTNQTSFFREATQFEDFHNRFLRENFPFSNKLNVLCAGCSSGEEAYTIAICYLYAKNIMRLPGTYSLKITAVDIDIERLKTAKDGVYDAQNADRFPLWVKEGVYFERFEQKGKKYIKIKDDVKNLISFEKHNLSSIKSNFKTGFYDAVFCRNTLIYFDKERQSLILNKLLKALKTDGTLYLGHSENPLEFAAQLAKRGHNIYVKRTGEVEYE
ncbi:MAG: protein-glutamate O-methyltransferase CheR [Campylobacterales bacterium]|nr:protein-glutamate O-methyltransferase CheR [Campylobacterales bacterium]